MQFVGNDWAEDDHDVELTDPTGQEPVTARLPEGVAGTATLHELIGRHPGEDAETTTGLVLGIETDRGPWVQALIASAVRDSARGEAGLDARTRTSRRPVSKSAGSGHVSAAVGEWRRSGCRRPVGSRSPAGLPAPQRGR
jgi:hypothetical protein